MDRGEDIRNEGNESEPLIDVIESDQAVEPDAKIAEELMTLNKKQAMIATYTAAKSLQKRRQRQRQQKETATALINISKQLDKQSAEIKSEYFY